MFQRLRRILRNIELNTFPRRRLQEPCALAREPVIHGHTLLISAKTGAGGRLRPKGSQCVTFSLKDEPRVARSQGHRVHLRPRARLRARGGGSQRPVLRLIHGRVRREIRRTSIPSRVVPGGASSIADIPNPEILRIHQCLSSVRRPPTNQELLKSHGRR